MTVSHLFYDFGMLDASVNYSEALNNPGLKLDYNVEDPTFKALMQAVALGTKATFSYQPTDEEMKKYLAAVTKRKFRYYKDKHLTDEEKREATEALVQAELSKSL